MAKLFGKAQQWVTRFPLMPVTGNHDEVDDNADEFVSHFNLPENGADGSIAGTTYSYDYGSAHFIMLNTESNKKEQTKWLEQDLAATDKRWIIVSVHRGPYAVINTRKSMIGLSCLTNTELISCFRGTIMNMQDHIR